MEQASETNGKGRRVIREVVWSAWHGPGLSHLRLAVRDSGVVAGMPFTDTLPIRRLGLAPGESAEVTVAYFDGAELQPWPEPQRYTCHEKGDSGGRYRFLSLDGGFTADLPVDADGLVLDYPGLFKRAFP